MFFFVLLLAEEVIYDARAFPIGIGSDGYLWPAFGNLPRCGLVLRGSVEAALP